MDKMESDTWMLSMSYVFNFSMKQRSDAEPKKKVHLLLRTLDTRGVINLPETR